MDMENGKQPWLLAGEYAPPAILDQKSEGLLVVTGQPPLKVKVFSCLYLNLNLSHVLSLLINLITSFVVSLRPYQYRNHMKYQYQQGFLNLNGPVTVTITVTVTVTVQ